MQMKDSEITSPEQLDAVLVGNEMSRIAKLWRQAEGHSFFWADLVGLAVGALLIVGSLYQGFFQQTDAMWQIILGLSLIGSAVYRRQQAQINALRELLKLRSTKG
jgi:hypothetical protein